MDATLTAAGGVSVRFDLRRPPERAERRVHRHARSLEGAAARTIADRYGARPPVARAADAVRTLEALYRDTAISRPPCGRHPDTSRRTRRRTMLSVRYRAGRAGDDRRRDGRRRSADDARRASCGSCRRATGRIRMRSRQLQRRLDDVRAKLRKRGFYEAAARQARNDLRGPHTVNLTLPCSRAPRHGALRGRSAAGGAAEGAGADRAGGLRVRRPARGFDRCHPVVSAPAGLLERRTPHGAARNLAGTAGARRSRSAGACRYYVAEPVPVTGNQAVVHRGAARAGRAQAGRCVLRRRRCRPAPPRSRSSIVSAGSPRRHGEVRRGRDAIPASPARASIKPSIAHHRGTADDGRHGDRSRATRRSRSSSCRPLIKLAEGQPFYQPRMHRRPRRADGRIPEQRVRLRGRRRHAASSPPTGHEST